MKPKTFLNQKVYYESDIRLRGWKLIEYLTTYTNGVSSSLWKNERGLVVRIFVY